MFYQKMKSNGDRAALGQSNEFFPKTGGSNMERCHCGLQKERGGLTEADANISPKPGILLMHFTALCWQGGGGNICSQFESEGCRSSLPSAQMQGC